MAMWAAPRWLPHLPCADGRVAVAALEPHFAARLCAAAGLPAVGDGPLRAPATHEAVANFIRTKPAPSWTRWRWPRTFPARWRERLKVSHAKTGQITRWDAERAFGFIRSPDSVADVFHLRDFQGPAAPRMGMAVVLKKSMWAAKGHGPMAVRPVRRRWAREGRAADRAVPVAPPRAKHPSLRAEALPLRSAPPGPHRARFRGQLPRCGGVPSSG